MGRPFIRKKIVLTQTNVAATDVLVKIACETEAGATVDYLSARKDPATGTRTLTGEYRNGSERIGLIAPLAGVDLSAAGVITLLPALNVNPQGSLEPLGVDQRAPFRRREVSLKSGDNFLLKAAALAENETLTVWIRAEDAFLIITNESGAGVSMAVTDN